MRKFVRSIYKKLGLLMCFLHEAFFGIAVKFNPVKEKSILFAAHPDDDVLFFNKIMKSEKPYVVLLTTGTSIIRVKEFKKVMKHYGLRYNYHRLDSKDKRVDLLESIIKKELKSGQFERCYTHSESGEYGHEMHRRVGEAVRKNVQCELFTPVSADEIGRDEYELTLTEKEEKINIFKTMYTSQMFVLDEYSVWVSHEKITEAHR